MHSADSRIPPEIGYNTASVLIWTFAVYALLFSIYDSVHRLADSPNQADYAHYLFFSDLLHKDINIYSMTKADIKAAKDAANYPVHIAGKPEYSPLFFLVFTPMTKMSFLFGAAIWLIAGYLALLASIFFLYILFRPEWKSLTIPLAMLVMTLNWPLVENMAIGNINTMVAAGVFFWAYTVQKKGTSSWAASAVLAGLLLMKPQLILLLLLLIARKKWTGVGWTVVFYALGRGLGALVYGPDIELVYWQNLIGHLEVSAELSPYNIGLTSVLRHMLAPWNLDMVARILFFIAAAALLILLWRKLTREKDSEDLRAQVSMIVIIALVISPLTESFHFLLMGLPLMLLAALWRYRRENTWMFILIYLLVFSRFSLHRFPIFDQGPLFVFNALPLVGTLTAGWFIYRSPTGNLSDG